MFGPRQALCDDMIAIVAAAGLVVIGPDQPTTAAGQRGAAFVWNYDPLSPLGTWYTPTGPYQYNTTSPDNPNNRIMRTGTGTYQIEIPGLIGFGAPRATAFGWDAAYCNSGTTEAANTSLVDVRCFNAAGAPVDHAFTLSFTSANEPWSPQFGHPSGCRLHRADTRHRLELRPRRGNGRRQWH